MDRADTSKIMAILKVAYPRFYGKENQSDVMDAINLWANMFEDDDLLVVSAAVKAFIATDTAGFPPSIGAIKEKISLVTKKPELTEMEAWNIVKGAMSYYATHEDFLKLPPVIQRAVGSASQLSQWAMMDMDNLPVIMSNFMRSYKAALNAEREYSKLPSSVRKVIEIATEPKQLRIGDATEE